MLKNLFNHISGAYKALKVIWHEWNTFTARKKWEILFKAGDMSGRLIGLNVLTDTKLSRVGCLHSCLLCNER